jgi:hypothetical protein
MVIALRRNGTALIGTALRSTEFRYEDFRVPTFLVYLGARVLLFQLSVNELARLDVRVT